MIYLLLFGLDLYQSFDKLIFITSFILNVLILIACAVTLILFAGINDSTDPVIKNVWELAQKVLKLKWLGIFFISLSTLMPSAKTVTIASGIYTGELIYDHLKDKPIAEKAYKLAEQKLDELLISTSSTKEKENK